MVVNQGTWCQESWDTGNPKIKARTKDLRKRGYHVIVSVMGNQITKYGSIKLTMLTIKPGVNLNTFGVGHCDSGL